MELKELVREKSPEKIKGALDSLTDEEITLLSFD